VREWIGPGVSAFGDGRQACQVVSPTAAVRVSHRAGEAAMYEVHLGARVARSQVDLDGGRSGCDADIRAVPTEGEHDAPVRYELDKRTDDTVAIDVGPRQRALRSRIGTAGRAVVFAGCTVVISLLGLFLIGVDFLSGMALATSLTVATVMVASITLLPALLGFAGRSIDRFSVGHKGPNGLREPRMWFRWSRVVQRRPWRALVGGLAVLVLLAVPLFSMHLAFPDAGSNPTGDTTRKAYDTLADGFGAGYNGPLILAADFPKGSETTALDALVTRLRRTPDVVAVTDPVFSPSGDAAVIRVIPTSSPQSTSTSDLVDTLRADVIPAALRGTDLEIQVGGLTASSIDASNRLASRLPIFIGAVLVLSFLLLMAVFRSLLVPLKAVVMNLLSIGAAYGVVVAVFQLGWLSGPLGIEQTGPIATFVPMMMFAILFGLSMDYEVFLLSRIREEYNRTGDNAVAVADGLASTARVITAAALIMVTVFGSFVLGDAITIKLFGLGLATAILVDATIVRMVLVPATMELLGDRNWWLPNWLDRLLPHLDVEGAPRIAMTEPAATDDARPDRDTEPLPVP
jgi:RND superfamily putative drug exporter